MPVKQVNKVVMDFDPKTKANLKKIYEQEQVRSFGKVTSTKLARFELIPKSALIALADRFELGMERKKEGSWNSLTQANSEVLQDTAFVIERLSHCIHHCIDAIHKVVMNQECEGEEDAGAILFAGAVLAEYKGIGKKE